VLAALSAHLFEDRTGFALGTRLLLVGSIWGLSQIAGGHPLHLRVGRLWNRRRTAHVLCACTLDPVSLTRLDLNSGARTSQGAAMLFLWPVAGRGRWACVHQPGRGNATARWDDCKPTPAPPAAADALCIALLRSPRLPLSLAPPGPRHAKRHAAIGPKAPRGRLRPRATRAGAWLAKHGERTTYALLTPSQPAAMPGILEPRSHRLTARGCGALLLVVVVIAAYLYVLHQLPALMGAHGHVHHGHSPAVLLLPPFTVRCSWLHACRALP